MQLNHIKKTFQLLSSSQQYSDKEAVSTIQRLSVLNDVNWKIEPGIIHGLIGPSAGGKSVLLKIIAGVLDFDSGEIDYSSITPDQVGLMFQEGALFDSLTAFENVAFPLISGNLPVTARSKSEIAEITDKVAWILNRVGLGKASEKVPGQLSGGMRKRLALARALVSRPQLVLLDDPTSGLDPVASAVIMKLITEIHSEYKPTMIIVSHDLRRLIPICDNLVGLFAGRIVFEGNREFLIKASPEVTSFVNCRYDLQ